MKKYQIKIPDRETSMKVQEAVFKAGFRWPDGSTELYTGKVHSFYLLNIDEPGQISVGLSSLSGLSKISAEEVIENPYILDGASVKAPKDSCKNYQIAIPDKKTGRKVQEALLSAGFTWAYGKAGVYDVNFKYLCLTHTRPAIISWANTPPGYTSITPEEVIENPYILDGASVRAPVAESEPEHEPEQDAADKVAKEFREDTIKELEKRLEDSRQHKKELEEAIRIIIAENKEYRKMLKAMKGSR